MHPIARHGRCHNIWIALPILLLFTSCKTTPPPRQELGSLRERVEKQAGRTAWGVYLTDLSPKMGWVVWELKMERQQGQEVAVESFDMKFKMQTPKFKLDCVRHWIEAYDLENGGGLIRGEYKETFNETNRLYAAERQGQEMFLTSQTNTVGVQSRVPIPLKSLGSVLRFREWLAGAPKKGDQFMDLRILWSGKLHARTNTLTYEGTKQILWNRVKTQVHVLSCKSTNGVDVSEYFNDGSLYKRREQAGVEWRREPEAAALLGGKIVLTIDHQGPKNSLNATGREPGPAAEVDFLKLELKGIGDFVPPESHRQHVISHESGTAVLEIRRDFQSGDSVPLTAEEQDRYLLANPQIQADSEAVAMMAKKIVGQEKDPLKIAHKLQHWLFKNIRGTISDGSATAEQVLKRRSGKCTDFAVLFVAMSRSLGLPARQAGGIMQPGRPSVEPLVFYCHAWAEIHDGKQWVSVDPTVDEVYVDAAHVKLLESWPDPESVQLWPLIDHDQIKLEVLDFKIRPK